MQTRHTFSGTICGPCPRPGRENGHMARRFSSQASLARLVALAAAQHGVFGLDQLRELGLTARAVRKRVAAGRLHRIHHGVYSLVPKALLKREGLYMAAVLACGPGAVLSHRSAARLHELRDYGYTRIEVTVPRRSTPQPPGHRRPPLDHPHRSRRHRRRQHPRDHGRPHPARPRPRSSPSASSSGPSTRPRSSRPSTSARSTTSSPATPPARAPRRSASVLERALHRQHPDRERIRGGVPRADARASACPTRDPSSTSTRATATRRSGPTSPGPTSESWSRPTGARRTAPVRRSRPIAGAISGSSRRAGR